MDIGASEMSHMTDFNVSMETSNYRIKARSDSVVDIRIDGDIGDDWAGESTSAKAFIERLNAISADTINLYINSHGGSVSDGLAIYNAIKRHPAKVSVYIDGVAASIASLICMAGDTINMAENALLMIPAPWEHASGNEKELLKMADTLRRYADAMATSYGARLGLERAKDLLADGDDHWFTASQALEAGLIDEVSPGLAIAAKLDLTRYKIPQEILEMPDSTPQAQTTVESKSFEQAMAAERERRSCIRKIAEPFASRPGVQAVIDDCLDDHTVDLRTAQDRILAHLGKSFEPLAGDPRIGYGIYDDGARATVTPYGGYGPAHFVNAATDALMMKSGQHVDKPAAGAGDLKHMRFADIAKAALNAGHSASVRHQLRDGASPAEIIQAAMSTSDFPLILENIAEKTLSNAYEQEPASHREWVRIGEVPDFKQVARVAVSSAPNLLQVPEGAEYTHGSLAERGEKFGILTYGRILKWTRQAMVNDDVGAFTRAINAFGRSASRLEADLVYTLLANNPAMSDGTALFHADHGNLLTAGALSLTTLGAAKKALRDQKDVSGVGYLNIVPRYLIVGTDDEMVAEQLLNSVYQPTDPANATPAWVRALSLVVDPRVSDGFYLAADHGQAEHVELATLNGTGVHVEDDTDFTTDAYSVKARLDVGVAAVDWAGINHTPAT